MGRKQSPDQPDRRLPQHVVKSDQFGREMKTTVIGPKQAEDRSAVEIDFRLIVDSIAAQIVLVTPAGKIEHLNRQAQDYFGRTLEEMNKWGVNDVVHPDDRPHAIERFGQSMATSLPYEMEHRLRRFDGEYRWFQARGLPLTDSGGRMVCWYILLTDIDQRKRAEEALRTSEGNLRKIIDTLPTTAWSTRPDGYVDFLSHRWLDYSGFSAEQGEGTGWGNVIHPDDAPRLFEYWQSCLASGAPVDVEARMRRFDGAYRWFLFRANPLRDEAGNIVKWFGTNIDIEDRKQADEKLRRSEALLAEGQELSSTGTFSWRLHTDEMTFSEELHRIFELDRSSVVTFAQIFTRIHPEDAKVTRDRLGRIRAGTATRENEMRLLMPGNRVKYLRVITRDVLDQDGRPERLGAIQDITQPRLAEEALSKARADLAHVARVTSLGVLTSSIAHEVNQPLAAIVTNSETSLRWLAQPEPDVAKVRELTKRVTADARRAAEIIDRIRTMATRREPIQTLLSLDDIVEESMAFLSHEFQSRGITLSVELTPALPRILGDHTQLQQVVVNLAINAVQAITQAEGTRRSILVRSMMSDPETICCAVEDSGPGLDPTHIPLLFDAFFTTKDSGMGMGLAISRSIIEAHGGEIRADNASSLGGARFSFGLPLNGTAQ